MPRIALHDVENELAQRVAHRYRLDLKFFLAAETTLLHRRIGKSRTPTEVPIGVDDSEHRTQFAERCVDVRLGSTLFPPTIRQIDAGGDAREDESAFLRQENHHADARGRTGLGGCAGDRRW